MGDLGEIKDSAAFFPRRTTINPVDRCRIDEVGPYILQQAEAWETQSLSWSQDKRAEMETFAVSAALRLDGG